MKKCKSVTEVKEAFDKGEIEPSDLKIEFDYDTLYFYYKGEEILCTGSVSPEAFKLLFLGAIVDA